MPVEITHLSRNYRNADALCDVSTLLNDGSITAVLGANGAGKSTLLQLLAGWLPPAKGRIQIDGYTLREGSRNARRRVMLLDEPRTGDVPMVEMIAQAIDDYQADRVGVESEIADWFERLDLVGTYGKQSSGMSKGQRYKIAMICMFIVRPKVWLLDEPFSAGLDACGLDILEIEMQAHAAADGIVVFSNQWPEHANRLADRTLVLHEGKLVCDQPTADPVAKDLVQAADPSLVAVLGGLGVDDD